MRRAAAGERQRDGRRALPEGYDMLWQITLVATIRAWLLAGRAVWLDQHTYRPPVVDHDGEVRQ